ncbi:hypothetical protein L1987_28852 [Smallanthus sonchifolius]|uniref:Uncharacterized protein n=1 Tax=Smallanthus sonchifolius TaxID=185202 RepID=A0ACB9HZ69_9ASTR|nr:hypothetical protein L1987_28852 [Smallanthus sonchifolius]
MAAAAAAVAVIASHSYSPQEQHQQQQAQAQQSTDTPQLSKKPKNLLHKNPLYTPVHSKLSCLEVMVQRDPTKLIGMCPKILTANINNELIPVFNFLSHDLKIPNHNYRKVINKCPRLLVSSVENQLKPALYYLKRLGFRDLGALAYQDCVLLVSNVENTLMPKLDYLISLGFSKPEAIEMVLRCPGLFTFNFPQYFAFSLEKRIKPRHMEAVECEAEITLPLLLKTTDEEFAELLMQKNKLRNLIKQENPYLEMINLLYNKIQKGNDI